MEGEGSIGDFLLWICSSGYMRLRKSAFFTDRGRVVHSEWSRDVVEWVIRKSLHPKFTSPELWTPRPRSGPISWSG